MWGRRFRLPTAVLSVIGTTRERNRFMSGTTPCISRRDFALSLCGVPLAFANAGGEFASMPWNQPATVAKVYLVTPGHTHWPKPTLDTTAEIAEVEARLAEVQRKHEHNVRL